LYTLLILASPSLFSPCSRALRLAFALQFLYVRIGLIVPFVYLYTTDLWTVYSSAEKHTTRDLVMVTILYVCCISLSSLQFVWGKIILEGLLKAIGVMSDHSERKRKHSDPEVKTNEPTLKRGGSFKDTVGQLKQAVEHLEVAELDVHPLDPLDSIPSPQIS
jgi:hypothetical protein